MIQTYNKWKKKNKDVSVGVFSYFAGMIVIIWLHLSHHGQSIRNPSDWSLSAHDKTFLSGWEQSLPGWLHPNTLWTQFMPFFSFHFSAVCTLLRTLESSPVFPVLSTSIHVQHFYTFYTWISENRALTSAAPGVWCTPLPYCTRHKWTSKTCEKKRRGGKKKEAAEMDREYFINGLWKEMNGVLYTRQQF